MIANYGYKDAEGEFYITIDTDRCARCAEKPCVPACPSALFVVEEDPYGEVVVAINEAKRKKLKYECAACKPTSNRPPLPCIAACPYGAVSHSW
jgi:Fe-S-cluster-containing hydrogenase component 2